MTPRKLHCPLVYTGVWFQNPTTDAKPTDAHVPYIKCWRSTHTVGPPHPQTPNCGSRGIQVLIEIAPAIHLESPLTSSFSFIPAYWNLESSLLLFFKFYSLLLVAHIL